MSTGERIKYLRKEICKLTQKELAEKLRVSPQVVSNWERGYTPPDKDDIALLADFFKCSTDYLLCKTNDIKGVVNEDTYQPLDEINKIMDELDIKNIFFHDIEAWKHFTPEDVEELRKHFEWVAHKAKERNKGD